MQYATQMLIEKVNIFCIDSLKNTHICMGLRYGITIHII